MNDRLNPYEVHDRVKGELMLYLDTYQLVDIEEHDALTIGCSVTKYQVTVYFNDNTKMVFRRNY